MFTNLNPYSRIDFLKAQTPEEMRDLIRTIPLPIKPLGPPQFDGTSWIVWIVTEAILKKNSSGPFEFSSGREEKSSRSRKVKGAKS